MNKSQSLYRLQLIDQKLDQFHQRQAEIQHLLADHIAENEAFDTLSAATREREIIEEHLADVEKKIQTAHIKLQQSESSLYGGKIHNPKELQDLEAEIKSIKVNIHLYEDDQFSLMLEIEKQNKNISDLEQHLSATRRDYRDLAAGLELEMAELRKLMDMHETEKEALLRSMDAGILQIYEKLRISKAGLAVTGIEENACTSCGAEITQGEWQRVRTSNELFFCSTCGRILYAR